MGNKLFVGGLPWATDEAGLAKAFSQFGNVTDARIICDRETGRSRGFGFVTFETEQEAEKARAAMDGNELEGRRVTVRQAEERGPRRPETIHRHRTPIGAPPRRSTDRSSRPPRRDDRGGRGGPPQRGNDPRRPPDPVMPPAGLEDWGEDKQRRREQRGSKKKKKPRHRFDDDDW
jgi:RNA recognition motif-containing protein